MGTAALYIAHHLDSRTVCPQEGGKERQAHWHWVQASHKVKPEPEEREEEGDDVAPGWFCPPRKTSTPLDRRQDSLKGGGTDHTESDD